MSITAWPGLVQNANGDPFGLAYTIVGAAVCALAILMLVVRQIVRAAGMASDRGIVQILDVVNAPMLVSFVAVAGARLLSFLR